MSIINTVIGTPLGWLFKLCVDLIGQYGPAIIVFTLLTKIILFPLSLWVQHNSIKMVRLMPRLNEIKAENANDKSRLSDLELALYKEEHYNPFAGVIPMLIQIPIILGLIGVVYHPLQHILRLNPELIEKMLELSKQILGVEELGSGAHLRAIELIKNAEYTAQFAAITVPGVDTNAAIESIRALNFNFLGLDLTSTPKLFAAEWLTVIPWLSGASAFFLSWCQNKINVLQKEASWLGRWGMAIFLTAFSLYFASVVPAGVGLYWIFGNLFAVLVLLVCNWIYPPKKFIDYEALEESKKHLNAAKKATEAGKLTREEKARSKADYKRFTKDKTPKQVVFFAEKQGYYKYFRRLINALLEQSDVTIHYITGDPHDAILETKEPRIVPYFIDQNRQIMLFMLVDSDIMVTSLPDLETYHLKRSYIRTDMEYIYVEHGIIGGLHLLRDHALDAYDTIFCGETNQKRELTEYFEKAGLTNKTLLECGYGVIEDMHEEFLKLKAADKPHTRRRILIAPSWQPDNILESCLGTILGKLANDENEIIIRPHPQYIRRFGGKLEEIRSDVAPYLNEHCRFEMDFSSNETVYTADILMTDWSTIAFEYAFSTEKPVLFIHTKEKIVNERTEELFDRSNQLDITLRNVLGRDLMPETLEETLVPAVEDFTKNSEAFHETIVLTRDRFVYNFGHSGEVGAAYIIKRLEEFRLKRLEEEQQLTV